MTGCCHLEDEPCRRVRGQREVGERGAVLDPHRNRRPQSERYVAVATASCEQHRRVAEWLGRVGGTRIVEAGIAPHLKAHFAANTLRPSYQGMGLSRVVYRHEVGKLGD